MKLISFQGLNCYSNSMVSIAHDFGVDYAAAFAGLWSERDFYYQPERGVYLSQRLPAALEALGVKLVMRLCDSPEQARELLFRLEEGEPLILGMDSFDVPWSQFFGLLHGAHFFIARYTCGDTFLCFDPTFNRANMRLPRDRVIACAYDISRMLPVAPQASAAAPLDDAREVLRNHFAMLRALLEQMERAGKENTALLAKYVDALLNNRYLYRHYLQRLPAPDNGKHLLMEDGFFAKWLAVKNGLNKALVSKDSAALIARVRELLCQLIDDEISMAKRMLS